MKRALPPGLWLLLCLLGIGWAGAAMAQQLAPIPAMDSPVVDTTGTLDAAQKQALVQQALDLQQRKGSQLQVLVVPTTQPEDIAQYTTRVFDQWKIGRKGVDDALLLVVAKDDHRVRIESGYGLEGAIPDAIANRVIQEYLVPHFRQDDYAGGITAASAVLVKLIDGEQLPVPVSSNRGREGNGDQTFFFAIVIGVIASVLMRLLLSRLPSALRGLLAAVLAGVAGALLLSLASGVMAAFAALFFSFGRSSGGGFAGGGGWGSGGFGGGGGGGWSGGGGRSGGGGASGSW